MHCHDMAGGYCDDADVRYLQVSDATPRVDRLVKWFRARVGRQPLPPPLI
jgi:hypothetical protein|eukprot:COSAG01_NODE_185_length_22691_cov_53.142478_9_plen_50_part_00